MSKNDGGPARVEIRKRFDPLAMSMWKAPERFVYDEIALRLMPQLVAMAKGQGMDNTNCTFELTIAYIPNKLAEDEAFNQKG